jgi:hypothetical protein
MNKILITLLTVFALSGCASIDSFKESGFVPSFWDDNQSMIIVDVQLRAHSFDCTGDQLAQVKELQRELKKFELYSQAKGWQQNDVLKLIAPMQETVTAFETRVKERGPASAGYCKIKIDVIKLQADRASQAVLGRF